jgi:uncharacterized repeat protein (TIGR01451 family)
MVNAVASSTVGNTCPEATGNTACRATVTILTPELTIVKTVNRTYATLGTTLGYTITATNTGQTTYPAAEFADSLVGVIDDATYGNDATASNGTVDYTGGVLHWVGALAPGNSVTVGYSATINNPATGDENMVNSVSSETPSNNCATGSSDSRCTTAVVIIDSVSLTLTKTADVVSTVADAVVHYTVTVANSDTVAVASANFTDQLSGILDDADFNGDALATLGSVTVAGSTLSWQGDLEAGDIAIITYSVTVHHDVTGNQVLNGGISSTSLPSSNNCVVGGSDPRCVVSVGVARLVVSQVASPSVSTTPGSVVTVSQTFTNTGAVPYLGITIVSPRADTSDDTVPTGDQVASSGTLVRTAAAVTWTGDIPVGGVVTSTRTLVVRNPDTGNRVITATLSTSAPGSTCPVGGVDARCTFSVAVLIPELTIVKTASATSAEPGDSVGYTITVHNTGEAAYSGAAFTDSLAGLLDDADYAGDAAASVGTVGYASPVLSWSGDLAVGQSATITYSVVVRDPASGDKSMVNAVASSTVGNTCPEATGNTACRATVTILTPELTITATTSAATTVPDEVVGYTITATNTGQTTYPAATISIPLSGIIDDAAYGGNASATIGAVVLSGSTLTWTGELAPGAVATITYSVSVSHIPSGNFVLAQTVQSAAHGNTCPTVGGDANCTTSVPIAGLLITNAAGAPQTEPTSVVHHTVTIINTGKVPFVGISVSDSLVGSLDDATYNSDAAATAGSLVLVSGTGSVVWTGDLAVGASVTVTGSLTVKNPDLGNKLMTTRVTTNAVASNCPTASPAPACLTSVSVLTPQLTISKFADSSVTSPGGSVGYTILITNTGETGYGAATATDWLGGVLDDATYAGDAVASSGDLDFADSTLSWVGELAVDETVVITYSIQINSPDFGDKLLVNTVASTAVGSTCPIGGGTGCSTFVMVLVPELEVGITADRSTTVPGAEVSYTISIHNSGQTDYVGASVSILLEGVLDDASYAGGATATIGAVVLDDLSLEWVGDLPIGATAIVSYVVAVNDPAIGNRALYTSVTSTAPGSLCSGLSCTNSVVVLIPGLAVSATADVATTTPGSEVAFTVTIANTGETDYSGMTIAASLADITDDASLVGAVQASSGVASSDGSTVSWTGSLPVGATAMISYRVAVDEPALGDKALSMTVVTLATGSNCGASSADPACTAGVTILIPSLTLSKMADAPTTTPGGVVGYTIVIANTGQTDYASATASDSLTQVLADADYNGDAVVTGGGTLEFSNSILSWVGVLPMGASVTISYSVTVHNPDLGDKHMVNTVVSTTQGSTCPPQTELSACTAIVNVLVPELAITQTSDSASVVAGAAVQYTITLSNIGQTDYLPAQFVDRLDDVLDDASYGADATASRGTVSFIDGAVMWTGALLAGESAVISYSVVTDFPALGDRSLNNSVLSTSPGAHCVTGGEPGCHTSIAVLVPALTIAKSADATEVVAGETLHYTIVATNTGEADYLAAILQDALADVVDDATYNADASATSGVVAFTDDALTWTGTVARGATVAITYSVTVPTSASSDAILANAVTSPSVGSTCTTGYEAGCSTVTTVAARSITLAGLTSSFTLVGLPDSTVTADGVVGMTVISNSTGGYFVTVQAGSAWLAPLNPQNASAIAIAQLRVRESGSSMFRSLSDQSALIVHQQSGPSSAQGDAVSNDYQIEIPFVPADTYTVTLNYIVSSQ